MTDYREILRLKGLGLKATAPGTVGIVSTCILAAIRNQKFFTLRELNEVIRE